jgi:DNA/RNA-binding domain of Phe-tRNA-synthetase-like protein
MRFQHAADLRAEFPELVVGVVAATGTTPDADTTAAVARHAATAAARLAAAGTPSGLAEVQAWRRAFTRLGLRPTQYRCASEALLRRFAREGALPRIHPLVDLCNAVSLATALPVAALDLDRVDGDLLVRRATGREVYLGFDGTTEHPQPGEVTYVDDAGRAHARRWTNRQSGHSAVRAATTSVLVVVEGLHATAADDVAAATTALAAELAAHWPVTPVSAVLHGDGPAAFDVASARPAARAGSAGQTG